MARKVFFSFHYDRDIFRANVVRNSQALKIYEPREFLDEAGWGIIKNDRIKVEDWIKNGLEKTSVTIVLIGNKTSERSWVRYEIDQSIKRGNGLIAIYIHNIKDTKTGQTDSKGDNPFEKHCKFLTATSDAYPICNFYDWVNDDGCNNIKSWIEKAAEQAGK